MQAFLKPACLLSADGLALASLAMCQPKQGWNWTSKNRQNDAAGLLHFVGNKVVGGEGHMIPQFPLNDSQSHSEMQETPIELRFT